MATFSLAPKPDPNSTAQILHDHYWNVMHRASFNMPGTWFQKMGTNPLNQIGKDNLTDAESIYQAGLDYCKEHNISVIENSLECRKRHLNGVAWPGRKIELCTVRPYNIRFKYQQHFPTKEVLARVVWHEIAHVELGHCGGKLPKSIKELEAEMVAYLVCLAKGRPYYLYSSDYIKRFFRVSHRLAEMALKSEVNVIRTVVNILGSEAQHGR